MKGRGGEGGADNLTSLRSERPGTTWERVEKQEKGPGKGGRSVEDHTKDSEAGEETKKLTGCEIVCCVQIEQGGREQMNVKDPVTPSSAIRIEP